MAIIRWHGADYTAEPVEQLPNGNWRMKVHKHGPRWAAGCEIEVKPSEVIEMAAAEMPGQDPGTADIEAAMAAERETLPTVQELIGQARKAGALRNQKSEEEPARG